MGWNKDKDETDEDPVEIEDFFKSSSDFTVDEGAVFTSPLKVMVWGDAKLGKTHFAMSFPEPIYVIDTEFGAPPLLRKFQGKDINIMSAAVLDPDTDEPDMEKSLDKLEKAISTLKDLDRGTIVIDSGSDIWGWLGAWVEQEAAKRGKITKAGTPQRLEWGRANLRWTQLILRLMNKDGMHFVITSQPRELYNKSGEAMGVYEPRVQKMTKFKCDLVLNITSEYNDDNEEIYVARPTTCRFQRNWDMAIEDVTFDKLTKKMYEDLGLIVPNSKESESVKEHE